MTRKPFTVGRHRKVNVMTDTDILDWLQARTSFLVHPWQGGGYTLTLPQPPVDGVRPAPIGFTGGTLREAISAAIEKESTS